MNSRYRAWFERDEDGGYSVWVPALPGCVSQGDTLEEAAANIREAIQCYLQSSLKHGEAIPDDSKMVEGRVEVPFNTEVAERAAEVPV